MGLSKYPFILSFPQDEHEKLLALRLREEGVEVEREVELVGCEQVHGSKSEDLDGPKNASSSSSHVKATLRNTRSGAVETLEASYVAGCDGAHSAVRDAAGIAMRGGTYSQRFFVADVDAEGQAATQEGVSLCTRGQSFCLVVPLKSREGGGRMIGCVPEGLGEEVGFEDVKEMEELNTGLKVRRVEWFSTYRVHARVAERFREKRLFLVGDAAHLHSPVGGQGMNTGLGDAVNVAWKLAAVLKGEADETLLDTYETERMGFAKTLVSTTDRIFTVLTDKGWCGWMLRGFVLPYVLPLLWSVPVMQTLVFRRISQIEINYRHSALSGHDSAAIGGTVKGGDRLPWVQIGSGEDNHEVLDELSWQVHIYGEAMEETLKELKVRDLHVHVFPWSQKVATAGLVRDALYLVRPDGYVGMVCGKFESGLIRAYLAQWLR